MEQNNLIQSDINSHPNGSPMSIVDKLSQQKLLPAPSVKEVKSILSSSGNAENGEEKKVAEKFKTRYTAADLVAMNITSIPALVDPIIPKVGLISLIGASDVGKSTLLLQLAADVALNNTFLDFPLKATHKSSLFVSTEDDKTALAFRLNHLKGINQNKLENIRFMFETRNLSESIDKELSDKKADVVIIDTFADIYPGEMNQINKVRYFMDEFNQIAQKHECLIIFNHHIGKGKELKSPSKNNSIGSAGFEGRCRLVMELMQDFSDHKKRHLCLVKGNYVKSELKTEGYELELIPNVGFKNTGRTELFEILPKQAILKPFITREKKQEIVFRLHSKGKSTRTIEDIMARLKMSVSKSTVSEWIKLMPVQVKTP